MFLKAVSAFLIFFGLLMAGFGIYFIALGYEAEGWTKVEGRITAVKVRVDISGGTTNWAAGQHRSETRSYYPEIDYEWSVNGETHAGSRYRLGESHEKYQEKADAKAAAAKFQTGAPITVYYDLDNPDRAILDPSLSVGVFVPLPLGLLFLGAGWTLFRYRETLEKAMAPTNRGGPSA